MPRSGSTLVCNLLNQHPHIYAGSTSILSSFVTNMINGFGTSTEIKSDLINDRTAIEARIFRVIKGVTDNWYSEEDTGGKDMVFDKGRGWIAALPPLFKLYPHAKVIVTVRDPRGVMASIEKQNAKNPLLDDTKDRSITKRVESFFSDECMVGAPIRGIEDALRRKTPVFYLKYEHLMDTPVSELARLHEYLEIDNFRHDLDNIKNTATDADALYNFKYPHEGCGRLTRPDLNEWKKYIPEDVGATLIGRFPYFCENFGYR